MLQSYSRYESDAVAAVYLEAEWSDMLFSSNPGVSGLPFDPMTTRAAPSFYKKIADIAALSCRDLLLNPRHICDVGSATGRTIYELIQRFDSIREAIAVEPALLLHQWSRRLLVDPPSHLNIPVVDAWNSPNEKVVNGSVIARPRQLEFVTFLNSPIERLDQSVRNLDLIVCCNLLDRHPEPHNLVDMLWSRLRPGGLLVLASPLEFGIETADIPRKAVTDIGAFLTESYWRVLSVSEELYDLRLYSRKWVRYVSQVVVTTRR